MTDVNTFDGWQGLGRTILQGQRAEEYGELPDGTWMALFREDQTKPRGTWTINDVVSRRSVDEHKAATGRAPKKPVARVDVDGTEVRIWVGSNKNGLTMVKQGDALFDKRTHRWVCTRTNPQAVVDKFVKHGFNVILNGSDTSNTVPRI